MDHQSSQQQQVDSEINPPEGWNELVENYVGEMEDFNIDAITQWLEQHPNKEGYINWKNADIAHGKTLLNCAIEYGRWDIVELLVKHDADITIADNDGDTPLMNASREGHSNIVKLLLDNGADIKIANKYGKTALMWASYCGHDDIVQLLLDKGADDSDIILMKWMERIERYYEMVGVGIDTIRQWLEHPKKERFLNWHDTTNANGANGATMLICGIWSGRFDVTELLLEHGADMTIADNDGDTPLMNASEGGRSRIVKLLLDKGADLKIANKNGVSALMHALEQGHTDVVRLLVDEGADESDVFLVEWKKLVDNSYELEDFNIETITLWLEHPKNKRFIDWKDTYTANGSTMLNCAIEYGRLDIVELLAKHDADITIADNDGDTPLMNASREGHTDIVKLLAERGADTKIANENGTTALMHASERGHTNIVKLLVDKGADISIADKNGITALMHASERGHANIVQLLLDNGADDSEIILVLLKTLIANYHDEMENASIIETITKWMEHPKKERFINWHDADRANGGTLLNCAAYFGRLDIVELLVKHGADITIADEDGDTPVMNAAAKEHSDIVKLLLDKGADYSDIILMEWKKIIENSDRGGIEKVTIETIMKWLEHPKKERFINWNDDNIANGRTMFLCALKFDRFDIARLLLEHGMDIHLANRFGTTPLMYASYFGGNKDIVELLMDKGADVNIADEDGWTALIWASHGGHTDIVRLFVDKGADPNITNENGETPLILAVAECRVDAGGSGTSDGGLIDLVKILVDKGADLNIANEDGKTALILALEEGHTDIVKLFVDKGADLNIANDDGKTALILALEEGHTDIAKLLVDKGADLNIAEKYYRFTALMRASDEGHTDIVKLLVDKGADINIANKYGSTALIMASQRGYTGIAKLLVDKGADISIANTNGNTALMMASRGEHADIVKLLVDKGADINSADKCGNTSLMEASSSGHNDIVKLMVDKDADVNIANVEGRTALMLASRGGHTDIVKILVDKDADIDIAGGDGWTALLYAFDEGHIDIVKVLLEKGADLSITTKNGWTALMLASEGGHTDFAKLLVDKGADITIANEDGKTALTLASQGGHTDIVKLLVDKGADITIANEDGKTSLMLASMNGHNDIVKVLVEKGADTSSTDKAGNTALSLANESGHTEIVGLLIERSLSLDIGSLLDAGVTIERLEELYPKEEVHNVVQGLIGEETDEEANRVGRPAAASTAEDGDEENVRIPAIPDASKIESSRSLGIGILLDAGATMEKLEEIYPKEEVHKVAQARIVKPTKEEDAIQRRRRGSMARLLFLRSKSTALKEVLRSSAVMDQVLVSLLADPEEKILMCPLMLTPLKDPVVISSGFVMDRSTALDENGNLRIQLCPFSRNVLSLPVYPCIPIRSKLKAWEAERMNRCIGVAEKMVESKEWERATKVFDIAETLLQEMGDQTYLNLATKLANLEREIPFVENDVERMVKIHQRLIRAAKGNKGETVKLLREAFRDCSKIFGGSMLSDDPSMLQECMKTRSAFSKEILSPMALINNEAELRDVILELYGLDLALAKKLKSTTAIWCSRRMTLGLWETQSGDDDETSKANRTKILEFLKQEGLTGNERELSLDNYDSLRYWPQDKLVDEQIGLVRFDDRRNARDGVETINSLSCKVDLNPCNGSDHWIEIAFRPIKLGSPSYKFSIFSQHGDRTGWEIRAGKVTHKDESNFVEAVWTTTNADDEMVHNEFFNRHVPVDPGQWYHVILSFNRSTLEVKLYVNGQPASKTVEGTFMPDSRFPMIGQNLQWPDRQFKGMVAFASGETEFPVEYAEADVYVQSLYHVRLRKLQKCSEAVVELDLTAGSANDYYYDSDGDY